MAPVTSIGPGNLDDLMDQMWWSQKSWTVDVINVWFPQSLPDYWDNNGFDAADFTAFDIFDRADFMNAVRLWTDLVQLDAFQTGFQSAAEIGALGLDLGFSGGKVGSSPGWPNLDDRVDVQISTTNTGGNLQSFDFGTGGFKLLLHEIGHALGLRHPGAYDLGDGATYDMDAEFIEDSDQYTIMSYFDETETGADFNGNRIDTPMLYDIYAIQNIYGADVTIRNTDTRYGYNATGIGGSQRHTETYDFSNNTAPVLSIWDPGGNDTLDLSGDNSGVTLDLRAGEFSSTHGMTFNLSIAFNPDPALYPDLDHHIENAVGGGGADRIRGNHKANDLRGNAGADTLIGFEGEDTLYGFSGDDKLYGWDDNDSLLGGSNNDTLYGMQGDDTLSGGPGNDYLYGQYGLDVFFGGSGRDTVDFVYSNQSWVIDLSPDAGVPYANNLGGGTEDLYSIEGIWAGWGNDTVYGSAADNELIGRGGNDRLYGYTGNDTLEGEAGDDWLSRGDGNNLVDGGLGDDTADYGQTSHAVNVNLHNQFSSQIVVDLPGTSNDQADHIRGIENFLGTVHDDTISGSYTFANYIDGRAGDDIIEGSGAATGGANYLFGSYGSDTIFSGAHNDTMHGGTGYDYASYDIGIYPAGVTIDLAVSAGQTNPGFGTDWLIGIEGVYGTDHADNLYGNSGANTLHGLDGNDSLNGRYGNDSITGGAGRDTLVGSNGNDTLSGGAGNDDLTGGIGDDKLYGSSGHNTLDGGWGDDTLGGGHQNDLFIPGAGDDFISGLGGADHVDYSGATGGVRVDLAASGPQNINAWEGNDDIRGVEFVSGSMQNDTLRGDGNSNKLWGLNGNDILEGRGGNDIIDGGMGSDTATFENSAVAVFVDLENALPQNTQAGIDSFISIENLRGSAHNDILMGDVLGNRIEGNAGNDWLFGRQGNDTLTGGTGDDLLLGGLGNDTLNGHAGNDTVSYFFALGGVEVDLALSNQQQNTGADGTDLLFFVENLHGSAFNDTLRGNHGNNELSGGGGNDTLEGNAGSDTLIGGPGNDRLDGGSGSDWASYAPAASGVRAYLTFPVFNTGDAGGDTYVSIENLIGTAHFDTLVGNGENNILDGGDSDDSLSGQGGDDRLIGGAGADILNGGSGSDTASYQTAAAAVQASLANPAGNTGDAAGDSYLSIENLIGSAYDDTLAGDGGDNRVTAGLGNDTVWGWGGDDTLSGQGGDDVLRGGHADDSLVGSIGNDTLAGGHGADTLDGGGGIDEASYADAPSGLRVSLQNQAANTGHAANDELTGIENLYGSAANDTLVGDSGDNVLRGWTGNDVLAGAQGNDTLVGGGGADDLVGGAGSDVFFYSAPAQSPAGTGRDTIDDFSSADGDLVDLAAIDANTGLANDQAFVFLGNAAYTGAGGELRFITNGSDGFVVADIDGDSADDMVIFMQGITAMSASDFDL